MSELKLKEVENIASIHLNSIAECFIPEAKLTLVVRIPGNENADFLLTNDNLAETINAIKRREKQETERG